jgi:hypothetical protein
METKVKIERGVPIVETRGRPTSDEYLKLLLMEVDDSFVSRKSRDTLYQIARNLQIKVSIKSAGREGWRVWKIGPREFKRRKTFLLEKPLPSKPKKK